MNIKKVKLFKTVDFSVVDYESASDVIIEKAKAKTSYAVFAMPVHGLVLSVRDQKMKAASQRADMIVPDGQPIRWIMNFFHGTKLKDRVYGPTLTLHVLGKANKHQLKVFLYGGNTQEVLLKFESFIKEHYPSVNVCGTYREEFPDGETLDPEVVNKSGAHIILVGRGCPKQELWIAKQKHRINGVMMGVGAAFSFHSGMIPQAPDWMQNNGLEWLFRLLKEPRRLLKRYVVTNSIFLFLVIKEIIRIFISPQKL
ncbi:MAG: WecB/TagA/CpsF family glycosyltransferase [Candidatus Cyclobacteriaceae bacterium M3_2C_046]